MANKTENALLSRRDALRGAAAVGAALAAGSALAEKGHHHGHNKHGSLVQSALDCQNTGHSCVNHCVDLFKDGDTSVAECADRVNEMLAMTAALAKVASYDSESLGKLAAVCMEVCENCEQECRRHEKHHAQCKACADSCANCAAECKKVAA